MSIRMTIFTDRTRTDIKDIAELHGRQARRFAKAIESQGYKVKCKTYHELAIRIDDILE